MVNGENPTAVQAYLSDMMALERQLEGLTDHLAPAVALQDQVADAFRRYRHTVKVHRSALDVRAHVIGSQMPKAPRLIVAITTPLAMLPPEHAVSQALLTLYTAFNHAAFGYSMLHVVAHRAFDSQEPDNTADLAEAHLRDYAAAIQEMNQLVSEAVVRELTQLGEECHCRCPACSLGVCLCSPHGTTTLNHLWGQTRPLALTGGLWVRQPRSASAAAQAGLRAGDRIVAIDGEGLASDWDVPTLQTGIRKHQSGEALQLRVLRSTGELEDITLTRP